MSNFSHALELASALPEEERLKLVAALLDTFDATEVVALSDAWLTEIERRSARYDTGEVETSSWTEVRERVRDRVKQRALRDA